MTAHSVVDSGQRVIGNLFRQGGAFLRANSTRKNGSGSRNNQAYAQEWGLRAMKVAPNRALARIRRELVNASRA